MLSMAAVTAARAGWYTGCLPDTESACTSGTCEMKASSVYDEVQRKAAQGTCMTRQAPSAQWPSTGVTCGVMTYGRRQAQTNARTCSITQKARASVRRAACPPTPSSLRAHLAAAHQRNLRQFHCELAACPTGALLDDLIVVLPFQQNNTWATVRTSSPAHAWHAAPRHRWGPCAGHPS